MTPRLLATRNTARLGASAERARARYAIRKGQIGNSGAATGARAKQLDDLDSVWAAAADLLDRYVTHDPGVSEAMVAESFAKVASSVPDPVPPRAAETFEPLQVRRMGEI